MQIVDVQTFQKEKKKKTIKHFSFSKNKGIITKILNLICEVTILRKCGVTWERFENPKFRISNIFFFFYH